MNIFSFFFGSITYWRKSNSTVLSFALVFFGITLSLLTNSILAFGKDHQEPSLIKQDDLQKRSFRERIEKLSAEKKQKALIALNGISLDTVDEALQIDANGDLYFVCPGSENLFASTDVATKYFQNSNKFEETYLLSAVPVLHSRPGSSKKLILDFDGHTVTGTAWNTAAQPSFSAVAYDTDGDPNTFSGSELVAIQNIWKRIAEDYAPFDIDITTEEPAVLTLTTGRVLITRNTDANGVANPSSTAGGVAYVGVFGSSNYSFYSPAWVYSNNLGGGREDYVAEAASHEAGHNLGLSHDGTATSSYYNGHGSGNISWAPLMGTGYNHNVSQWSRGEYPGANNTAQDDLAVIAGKTGYRPDDFGNDSGAATPLSINSNNASNVGVIETTTDVDVFSFATTGGNIAFHVQPFLATSNTRGGNLDVKAEILDSGGNVVASNDLATQTYTDLAVVLAAGNYYLRVSGVGAGDLITGYSDYGSLGQYTITGTVPVSAGSNVKFDFDGDRKADVAVYRSSNGTWYFSNSSTGYNSAQFGAANDKIVPADYDGDGKTDVAVYRAGVWYLQRSALGFTAVQLGLSTDIAQPADFDGDGRADIAVFRPSNGNWYVLNSSNNQFSVMQFGSPSDKPVAADYDGDNRADYAVYRPSNGVWYMLGSTRGFTGVQFGISADIPTPADYDGDGHTDQAVFRNGTWHILQSAQGYRAVSFGLSNDNPIAADYDGDGKSDIAVYRNGVWYYQKSGSNNQLNVVPFGLNTDAPIPASFVP